MNLTRRRSDPCATNLKLTKVNIAMYHPDLNEEYGIQSEALNCLEEARAVAASIEPAVEGTGPWEVQFSCNYYCRATDALAGSYISRIVRFETVAAAEHYLTSLADYYDEDCWVTTNLPREEPAAAAHEDDDDDSGIPF